MHKMAAPYFLSSSPIQLIRGIFVLLLGYVQVQGQSEKPELSFRRLTTADGLSQNTVTCVLKDSQGYMWFGTWDGLNKYDGYNFTAYRSIVDDTTSISSNRIVSMLEDRDHTLWIATVDGGLNQFDRNTNTFVRYQVNRKNPLSISSNNLKSAMLEDRDGHIWIGTLGGGLNRFDKKRRAFTHYEYQASDTSSLSSNEVNHVLQDSKGNLWVGTREGLDLFDRSRNQFIHYQYKTNEGPHSGYNYIRCLFEDSQGNLWVGTNEGMNLLEPGQHSFSLFPQDKGAGVRSVVRCFEEDTTGQLWIGTENGGLHIFNQRDQSWQQYLPIEHVPGSLNSMTVYDIYKDDQGSMWMGLHSGGVGVYDRNSKKFTHYSSHSAGRSQLSNNNVTSFAEDRSGKIWIATDGGGINQFDPANKTFTVFKENRTHSNGLLGNFVLGLLVDSQDYVWSSSWGEGINVIHPNRTTITHYQKNETQPGSIRSHNNNSFREDSKGNVWIGSYGGGLHLFDRKTQRFVQFKHDPDDSNSLSNNYVRCLLVDNQDRVWIGTESAGVTVYDPQQQRFSHYAHHSRQPKSLSNNFINAIWEDGRGRIWVATGSGLNRFDPENRNFQIYNEKDGLPVDLINAIQEDKHGNLWLSTSKGISRLNPDSGTVRNYTVEDGLQGNDFNFKSSLRSRSGRLYFGGVNGFNEFYPDSIRDNPFPPPVVLTNLQIFNKTVLAQTPNSPLTKDISQTREITLSYRQSVFSFEFAALNYSVPQKNQYAYRLEGFDKDWNYVGNKRQATYTNLDPGEYTFRVKASNNDGIWNEEGTAIKVTIVPPWWQSWWFRIGVALAAISLALSWYHLETYRIRRRNRELEVKVLERTNEIEQQKQEIASQRDNLNQLNEEISRKNEELERKVDERTKELQAAVEELNANFEELIKSNEEVTRSLHEKEVLLAEVHHRVKNNLAVVSGLLQMQIFSTDHSEVHTILQESQNRIKSMALIHEKLYQNGTFASIDFSDYVRELVSEIGHSYPNQAQAVQVQLDLEPIRLELTVAIPCGLLLNELLSNAYKHAFKGRETGRIDIVLRRKEAHFLLQVKDDGPGLDTSLDIRKTTSMGMKLIQTMVKQLHGQMEFRNEKGLLFRLEFAPVKMKTWT